MANLYSFISNGNATTPQADDAEVTQVAETQETGLTLPRTVRIVDLVLNQPPAQLHQYSIWIGGRKISGNFFSPQLSPNNASRINVSQLGLTLPAGARVQVRASQKTGTAAEQTILTLVYE